MKNYSIQDYLNWCKGLGLNPKHSESIELYDAHMGVDTRRRLITKMLMNCDDNIFDNVMVKKVLSACQDFESNRERAKLLQM